MKSLLNKDLRLAASPLTWIFLAAAFMTLLPGYPILIGAFFVCFGIFHTFQNAREANDVLYTVLLPVKKSDAVASRYVFVVFFQMLGFAVMAILTAVRMTAMAESVVYRQNALMNASPTFLAFVLLVYAAFNVLFVGGFFKTAYKIGISFVMFGVAALLLIVVAEVLHHLPGLAFLNVPSGERLGVQFAALLAAAAVYALTTLASCRASMRRFEHIDL